LKFNLFDMGRKLSKRGSTEKLHEQTHLIPPLRVFPRPRSLFDSSIVKGFREVMSYRVGVGFYPVDVWVRVYENGVGGYLYHVEEPRLNRLEATMYEDIMNLLYFEPPEIEESERFFEAVVDRLDELLVKYSAIYTGARINFVRYYLLREALGYSVIDPIMRDPHIEDVSCNGYYKPVYVWHTNYEYVETTMRIPDRDLDRLVLKLAHISGKHISIANPIVDAVLPGGHRLAATYRKEVTTSGSSFTIRKFREKPISVVELITLGTIDPYLAAYSWVMMEYKRNGMILGVTGAGKTTLLNAVATLIHPSYKVVTIEDTPELRLPLPNWVQLVAREFAVRSDVLTTISLFDLVKLSLRYRPEIIMVGEVRGEEAYVLFQAMASVSGDTPVMLKDSQGRVVFTSIGDFVDMFYRNGEERVVKPVTGVWVLSHNRYKVTWKPVRYVLRHSASRVYRVIAETGVDIRATGSHSVYVLDPETLKVKVKRVDELAPGDYLLTLIGSEKSLLNNNGNTGLVSRFPGLGDGDHSVSSLASRRGVYALPGFEAVNKIRVISRASSYRRSLEELLWFSRIKGDYATMSEMGELNDLNELYSVKVYNRRYIKPSAVDRVPVKAIKVLIELAGIRLPGKYEFLVEKEFISADMAREIIELIPKERLVGKAARHALRIIGYINGDLKAIKVKRVIDEDYNGYVYDVSVPGSESFLGGNVPVLLHNTGHGGVSTMHAESIESAVERLNSPPMNIPKSYIPLINFAMMIRRVDKGGKAARRVTNVWEIKDYNDYIEVFRWKASKDVFERRLEESVALERIAVDLIDKPVEELIYREIPIRALLFHSMARRGLLSFRHVAEVISRYYSDKSIRERVLEEAKDLSRIDKSSVLEELLDTIKR